MKRYVLITLGIGFSVALVALILYFLRVFEPLSVRLNSLYDSREIYPRGTQPGRFIWVEALVIALSSIWICWCLADLTSLSQKLIVFFVSALVVAGISPCLALYGIFFDPFSSLTAVILGASAATGFSRTELGKRKKILERVLGRRVSQRTFNELMEAPKPPVFEGHTKEVTVLNLRLCNRAELADTMKPADFLRMTNLFRRTVSSFLASQGAYLDEAGPEIIRAYFGIFHPDPAHAARAVRTALALKPALKTLNQDCQSRWSRELKIGAGLSSGDVIVGIYGSKEHYFLSGIGPEVDFSRRLSKANRQYGSDLLIGPGTYQLVKDLAEVRPMEMFYDPEKGSMTEIYELLDLKENFGEDSRQLRDHYWQGVILFREKKYVEAIDSLSKARIPGREDGPLEFFIQKVEEKMAEASPGGQSKSQLTGEGHSRLLGNL